MALRSLRPATSQDSSMQKSQKAESEGRHKQLAVHLVLSVTTMGNHCLQQGLNQTTAKVAYKGQSRRAVPVFPASSCRASETGGLRNWPVAFREMTKPRDGASIAEETPCQFQNAPGRRPAREA